MRIQIINPNTTTAMTKKIGAAARAVAAAGTEILATQSKSGPESIEGYVDEAYSVPGLLNEIVAGERAGLDGHVIACFDDTGLDAARALAQAPVVGIGEAAYFVASLVGGQFTVITTLSVSIPALRHNIARYGLASRSAGVRAVEVPVLALEDPKSGARDKISSEIARARREDRADAIVLGCAGMADLAGSLSEEHGLPVVEGVSAAIKLVESLGALGLKTSKVGGWASPRPKGYFAALGLAVAGAR
jgi:allantoin racemase